MMDVMEELDGVLTFEALVMAPDELDPYVLSFYPGAMEDGFVECYALCVMRREGGVPTGVLSEEFLDAANSEEGNGVFGPSCTIEVSSVILDNGVSSPTGEKVAVVLIDCTKDVVDHLHLPGIVDELDYGFAEDQPFALPSPDELVLKATGWISVASHQRVGYYSAESAEETPAPALEAGTKKKAEPKKTKPGAGLPIGTAKSVPKPKRATTASLAASLDSLMVAIPTLTTQVQALQDRQVKFEEKLAGAPLTTRSQLTQPLSSLLQTPPRTSFDQVAKNMTPPPRTSASPTLGILAPLTEKPAMLKELESEKQEVLTGDQGSLAQAVLAQSQALTTLVSQIASAGSDPMADLSGAGTSSGSRGAQGRARLQAELALQKGTFFTSVLHSMARRMAPTSSVEITPQEMLVRGISGTRYVERFGGYGRMKEWGQLGDDCFGLLDGRELPGGKGHCGTPCSHFGTGSSRQWSAGDCEPALPARGCSFRSIHEQTDQCYLTESLLRPACRPTMDHLCFGLPEGDGRDCRQKTGVCRRSPSDFCHSLERCRSKTKAQTFTKEKRKVKGGIINRRGRSLRKPSPFPGGGPTVEHGADDCAGGQESNPLLQVISFRTWAICLPRWILSSRTSLGWHLFRSFTARWRRPSPSTATLPLPVPYPGCFGGDRGGPQLSVRRLARLAQQRALHIAVIILNKLYLRRFASLSELERCPNRWQRTRLNRLRAFYVACGSNQEMFPLAPGRSGPELGAMLFQLEKFVQEHPLLASHYHGPAPVEFSDDPELLPAKDHPELAPYKALDVSRLKLVGRGLWKMESFLDDALWLPFVEPRFLAHGEGIDEENIPNFDAESEKENLALVRLWEARGLARCFSSPLWPGHNAHKSELVDRQIGDRRLPNMKERHLDGPSRHLPPGPLLCNLWVPRSTHCLRGSITDRRDFYHQAAVTMSRARSNCLPFAFRKEQLRGLQALDTFETVAGAKRIRDREIIGDELGPPRDDGLFPSDELYVGFGSLFQGDHLGVEFALSSHKRLLRDEGLLSDEQRILGHHPVPDSSAWQALVIDDFFCVSSQPITLPKVDSFAFKALVHAREAYDRHKLEGSTEKDVVAETKFKAAGAEVDSSKVCTDMGLVLVSAPLAKRIGLSTLSLRAAKLQVITSKLASRLSGNWVSTLLYRRCFASLVSQFFGLAASCEREGYNLAVSLPWSVAEELVSLAAVVPLISTNVATPYSSSAYASDASLAAGAVVETRLSEETVRTLWLGSNKKGHYTRLSNPFAACLRAGS